MANVCSKCGNNLYGNKTKCPFCGEPIGSSSRTTTSRPSNSASGNKLNSSSYQSNTNKYDGYNSSSNQSSSTGYLKIISITSDYIYGEFEFNNLVNVGGSSQSPVTCVDYPSQLTYNIINGSLQSLKN